MSAGQWLSQVSATFTGAIAAAGLVAAGVFVWLPGEFANLEERLEQQEEILLEVRKVSQTAASASEASRNSQDALVQELARTRAIPVGAYDLMAESSMGTAGSKVVTSWPPGNYMSASQFLSHLPADVSESIKELEMTSAFKYADFVGSEWIFVSMEDFNNLASNEKAIVQEAFINAGFRFYIEPVMQ